MGIRTGETFTIDCSSRETDQLHFYRNKYDDLVAVIRIYDECDDEDVDSDVEADESYIVIPREDVPEMVAFLQRFIDNPRK